MNMMRAITLSTGVFSISVLLFALVLILKG